jgi:hypothetical protein
MASGFVHVTVSQNADGIEGGDSRGVLSLESAGDFRWRKSHIPFLLSAQELSNSHFAIRDAYMWVASFMGSLRTNHLRARLVRESGKHLGANFSYGVSSNW